MAIIRWQRPESSTQSAFDRLFTLRDELDRIFESPWREVNRAAQYLNGWAPAVDVYEDKDTVTVKTEAPGMKKEEFEVTLHEGVLSVRGERKTEKRVTESQTHCSERFFGRFQRSVTLPAPVNPEKITASYKDGVLTVVLPKTEEAKPKQIQVNVQ
jgi:HSP20 family protein